MPDTKISDLTASSYLDGDEILPLASGGANERATVSLMLAGVLLKLRANYTLASVATQQKLFNSPANGAVSLPTGTYLFECCYYITNMSATSGNAAFSLIGAGTASTDGVIMASVGVDALNPATAVNVGGSVTHNTPTSGTNIVTAGTGTSLGVKISGTFDITVAGTLIPSVALQTAAAAVVNRHSYFHARRVGDAGVASIGNWS